MKIKTYSLKTRRSKVNLAEFANPEKLRNAEMISFFEGLPQILRAKDFLLLGKRVAESRKKKKPFILMMGAHPIKCGLSPLINDLLEKNIITHIATNGASLVHDFEISYAGFTSEDVAKQLPEGRFGMAQETLSMVNRAITRGAKKGLGAGASLGEFISKSSFKNRDLSIFARCFELGIPATVHVAIGTDIVHQSPECRGEDWGKTSYKDFLTLVKTLKKIEGGVLVNFGSAVIMPEVFLKALNLARNQGSKVRNFTAANFDQTLHYRVKENILVRPGGEYFNFIGQHEIMFPLFYKLLTDSTDGR